ncbi:MAG: hypothetical protein JEZ03_10925, partial [Bacteroidales bacterium]|nr:hypothetical protein [Bacteroidales bacterium]
MKGFKTLPIVILVFTMALTSCTKREMRKVEGITETNGVGEQIGEVDYSDWGWGDKWPAKVKKRFSSSFGGGVKDIQSKVLCYPNPHQGDVWIQFDNLDNCKIECKVINEDQNRIISKITKCTGEPITFEFTEFETESEDLLRMHYKITY